MTRDTPRDECALHRFIVWAAVKRNDCDKMTPEEKRECPLLRCRKRFTNHELMLQHLYSCDQLDVGEYWCYSCGKVETFSDAKCKKCLGHPSRRRRIVSMAKNFFRDLGHKSKNSSTSFPDLDLDIDEQEPEAPPSYDSLVERPRIELPSNEIHEIDSCELPLSTILEDVDEPDTALAPALAPISAPDAAARHVSDIMSLPIPPLAIHPAELESGCTSTEFDWNILPDTVAPENLYNLDGQATDRPALQLYTTGLEQYRAQQKKRSKMLAPSSSVRSTSSTNSTDSTNSTNSTNTVSTMASYDISPISAWSGPWARATGFESTLTSPSDDVVSPGGLVPSKPFAHLHKATMVQDWGTYNNEAPEPYLSELPADIPMMDALPTDDSLQGTLVSEDQVAFSFVEPLPTKLPSEPNPPLIDENAIMTTAAPSAMIGYWSSPRALINSASDALQMHVDTSMAKLGQMNKNHLVNQLRSLSTRSIASNGIETLMQMLEGQQPTEPVKILCFVHLIYCFSLVVHEHDAPSRWMDLFGQAMSYSTRFSRQDRQSYVQIVDALWKPAEMTEAQVISLVRSKTSSSASRTPSLKGKEREVTFVPQQDRDSLVFVAHYFLDQLEHSVVNSIIEPEIQSSDLYIQHLSVPSVMMHQNSLFATAVNVMLKHNFQQYSHFQDFAASLNGLSHRTNSNSISTPRRLELELMSIGKICLPSDLYFGGFIQHVRTQVDSLYCQQTSGSTSRSTYFHHGAKLIMKIICPDVQATQVHAVSGDLAPGEMAMDVLGDFIQTITPGVDEFDFGSVEAFSTEPPLDFSSTTTAMTMDHYILDDSQLLPTPGDSAPLSGHSTAMTSQSPSDQAVPTPASASASASAAANAAKTESVSCCSICGYRPKGDPRWFGGSMAKHKKLQHAPTPPKIYQCPFPGCTSQYKNRPDNLRQHQIEKGHFVDGQDVGRRPIKRKKTEKS